MKNCSLLGYLENLFHWQSRKKFHLSLKMLLAMHPTTPQHTHVFKGCILGFKTQKGAKRLIIFHKGWSLGNMCWVSVPVKFEYFNTYWQMDYCSLCRKACLVKGFWKIYIGLILSLLLKCTFYPQRHMILSSSDLFCRKADYLLFHLSPLPSHFQRD